MNMARCTCPAGNVGGHPFVVPFVGCVDFGQDLADRGIDGLVGMDFLEDHCLDIDWGAGVARISRAPPEDLSTGHQTIPIKLSAFHHPYVLANVGGAIGMGVMIDTGSYETASIASADLGRVFPDGWGISSRRGVFTLNGRVHCQEVSLPELRIGNARATNVLCCFRPVGDDSTSVGCGFLCDYRAIFDFPNRTLVLIPRAKPRVPEQDMSGIHVAFRAGDHVIDSVDRDSPAARAGLCGGETLESIDGVAASDLRRVANSRMVKEWRRQRRAVARKRPCRCRTDR